MCLRRHAGRVEQGEAEAGGEEAVEEPRGAQQRDGVLVQVDAGADKQHSGQDIRAVNGPSQSITVAVECCYLMLCSNAHLA